MTLADALSRYHPQPAPEIPLDIAIHHTHLTTQCKTAFQNAIMADPELSSTITNDHQWMAGGHL